MAHDQVAEALDHIFRGIEILQNSFKDTSRKFTVDGRLVGDIGEIIVAFEFDIQLDPISKPNRDGCTSDSREVQIKATLGNSLTFNTVPELYLGLKLSRDGNHEVIFNGPGKVIANEFRHRRGLGKKLLSFSNSRLSALSSQVPENQRVPRRLSR